MPELPEVETIVRDCRPRLVGQRIVAFESRWPRGVQPSVAAVRAALVGRTIADVTRRAKFIILHLDDGGCLLIHLRMSGRMEWLPATGADAREPSHVRAVWTLASGARLALCDARKFGRITHTRDLAQATAHVGPEPLDGRLKAGEFARRLCARHRQLKPLLLDQSFLAGLGNIYTDEALFRAGLHPLQPADKLSATQAATLLRAIRAVLRQAIRCHGTTLDWIYPGGWMQRRLRVYGRTGEPCRRCRATIVALRVGQRGTHVCPRCQPPPSRPRRKGR